MQFYRHMTMKHLFITKATGNSIFSCLNIIIYFDKCCILFILYIIMCRVNKLLQYNTSHRCLKIQINMIFFTKWIVPKLTIFSYYNHKNYTSIIIPASEVKDNWQIITSWWISLAYLLVHCIVNFIWSFWSFSNSAKKKVLELSVLEIIVGNCKICFRDFFQLTFQIVCVLCFIHILYNSFFNSIHFYSIIFIINSWNKVGNYNNSQFILFLVILFQLKLKTIYFKGWSKYYFFRNGIENPINIY